MSLVDCGFQRRRGWAIALLAALLLRALIPAVFMPAVGAGSLALVFCEPGALAVGAAHGAHHHQGQDGAGKHSAAAECPFAQSAAPWLATLAVPPPPHPLIAHVLALGRELAAPHFAPLRYAAARGPPSPAQP